MRFVGPEDSSMFTVIARLESKIDTLAAIVDGKVSELQIKLDERLEGMRHAIEFGDRSALQTVQILAESVHRLEGNQQEQGRTLRQLDNIPSRVGVVEQRHAEAEGRIALLERDRAKLIGFLLGAAAAGGGVGAAIAQMLGG